MQLLGDGNTAKDALANGARRGGGQPQEIEVAQVRGTEDTSENCRPQRCPRLIDSLKDCRCDTALFHGHLD